MDSRAVTLSPERAGEILRSIGQDGPVSLTFLRPHNHVWRLEQGGNVFFLKTYTKDWYGGDVAPTGYCVIHEVSAYSVLAQHRLPVPQVALAAEGCDNPLGRPFLLTRALPGESLTNDPGERETLASRLFAVGGYLRRMHAVAFRHPGYIIGDGPVAPPRDGEWQHRCWTARQRQRTP